MAWLSLVAAETCEGWNDPEFEAYYRDTYKFGTPPPITLAIEAHQREALRGWCRWWWTAFLNGIVHHPLKEVLRAHIANRSRCDF
jgi:hypothetical protein